VNAVIEPPDPAAPDPDPDPDAASPAVDAAAAPLLEPDGGRESTLLIVDDVADNLTLLLECLDPHYRVRVATNGPRALSLARVEPTPDLILLDIMMPGMNGYEVFARLRADPATRGIPVMFVTAIGDPDAEQQGLDIGAADYIVKPLRPSVVLARVRTQLELKRARDVLAGHAAALEAEVARRMADNERVQDAAIHALARLAEKRDSDTGLHLRRTQEYVRALALRLRASGCYVDQLDDAAIAAIAKSAPLHDIGKVAIPDQILLKPGPLTPAEWEVMRTHASQGRDAIERAEQDVRVPLEFLAYAKQITHSHHERWDGGGYPEGLAGQAIPLSARLMALADVFDALTSARVYKAAYTPAVARDLIVAESGRQFDPAVVDAFVASFAQFAGIADTLRDPAGA
jgi:putative two-component system response regulator